MKSDNGILTEKEIQARTKFWNKKQFRTWGRQELERTSRDMQNLLAALRGFSMDEIRAIRESDRYGPDSYCRNEPEYIVRMADQRDLDYAVSIAPKTFKAKQGQQGRQPIGLSLHHRIENGTPEPVRGQEQKS